MAGLVDLGGQRYCQPCLIAGLRERDRLRDQLEGERNEVLRIGQMWREAISARDQLKAENEKLKKCPACSSAPVLPDTIKVAAYATDDELVNSVATMMAAAYARGKAEEHVKTEAEVEGWVKDYVEGFKDEWISAARMSVNIR